MSWRRIRGLRPQPPELCKRGRSDRNGHPLRDRRPRADAREPRQEVRHVAGLLDRGLPLVDDREERDVGDRELVGEILAPGEPAVEHAEEAEQPLLEERDVRRRLLGRVVRELEDRAARHGRVGAREHEPVQRRGLPRRVLRQQLAALLGEVERDRAGLRDRERLPARTVLVDDRGDRRRGVDREVLGLARVARREVELVRAVGEARFLERDRGAMAVAGAGGVEVDHPGVLLLTAGLQRGDPLLDRRVGREDRHPARTVVDAHRLDRLGQVAGIEAAEARERVHHRPRVAEVLCRARVGAELPPPREPRDDDRGEDPEQDLADHDGDEEAGPGAALGAEHRPVDDRPDDAREEDHEGVHDALEQGHRHHVAVRDVRDLVAEHRFDLLLAHRLQQAGGDGDERRVLERAGREGVRLALVDRDLRHADAGLLRKPAHRLDEPVLGRALRAVDDLRLRRPLGHLLGDEERDDRAGEADDGRKGEQRAQVETLLRHRLVEAEEPQDDRQDRQHGDVGEQKQHDAHHLGLLVVCLRRGRGLYRVHAIGPIRSRRGHLVHRTRCGDVDWTAANARRGRCGAASPVHSVQR